MNLSAHWKYLRYVVRHKWFVLREGLRVGAPLWRLLTHDWTKFLPSEWFPYVRYFYADYPRLEDMHGDERLNWLRNGGLFKEDISAAFDIAWNHHQKANPHHWQYWLLTNDSSEPKHSPLRMPESFVREMVADWAGAGLAITGNREVYDWYLKNKDQIILHPETRSRVEYLLVRYYESV